MIKRAWILPLILFAVVGFAGFADADLIVIGTASYEGRDYKLIYEDDKDLIWLDYSKRGDNWYVQTKWATGLNLPGVLTYKLEPWVSKVSWEGDWRLPETADGARRFGYDGTTTAGFNITTSDLGHLYYKSLGNLGVYDTKGNQRPGWYPDSEWGPKNTEPFTNLQADMYWSSEYSINPTHAWHFNFAFGDQANYSFKASYSFLGIAVRPGKVMGR